MVISDSNYMYHSNNCISVGIYSSKKHRFSETDSEDEYLNRNYVSYNGGKEAESFFENFVKLDNFNNISFKYRDNDAKFTLRSCFPYRICVRCGI